jgi:hypothetical protein
VYSVWYLVSSEKPLRVASFELKRGRRNGVW